MPSPIAVGHAEQAAIQYEAATLHLLNCERCSEDGDADNCPGGLLVDIARRTLWERWHTEESQ